MKREPDGALWRRLLQGLGLDTTVAIAHTAADPWRVRKLGGGSAVAHGSEGGGEITRRSGTIPMRRRLDLW